MASTGSDEKSGFQNCDKKLVEFEEKVKERIYWARKRWNTSGEENSRFHSLCNSMTYWSKKLKAAMEKTSVIITLFNYDKDVKTSLLEIIDGLLALDKKVDLRGFTEFRNPRYICFHFKNEEEKMYVENNFRMLNDNYVVYLSWASGMQVKTVKVHWLIMTMDINIIKRHLEKYFIFKEHKQDVLTMMSGKKFNSGKLTFKANMKEGVNMEDVPHLMMIEGLEALITVQGHSPLCLTCDKIGHIARECPTPFCHKCRALKTKVHDCDNVRMSSYAGVVSGSQIPAEFDEWNEESYSKPEVLEFGKDTATADVSLNTVAGVVSTSHDTVTEDLKNVKSCEISEGKSVCKDENQKNSVVLQKEEHGSISTWADDNEDDVYVGDEDSDLDVSESEAVKKMDSYMKELNTFKILWPPKEGEGRREDSDLDKNESVGMEDMQIDSKALKRKIKEEKRQVDEIKTSPFGEQEWVKCYGRRGRGRRARNRNKFFQDEEVRDFIFKD